MMAEYKNIHPGKPYLGSFTGKSVINGGSLGRREATGKGVYFTFRYMLHDFIKVHRGYLTNSSNPFAENVLAQAEKSLSIAVQGFGNVGSIVALEAHKCTYLNNKVVAVSDRNVTLYNADGLSIPALIDYANRHQGDLPKTKEDLAELELKADILEREEVLYLDVDVLVLAALEEQVREDNVAKVKAKIIVEGANAPITGEADQKLSENGVIIIPDILANAGGVIVSYFEWLQGRETQYLTEEQVHRMLFEKMQSTLGSILPSFFSATYTLRQNCYNHSVMKLSTVLYRQGKLY